MYVLPVLIYPALLAALLLGAGLLADRVSGRFLPGALLLTVGGALLIAATQLVAYVPAIAPASPYVALALALAGLVLGRARAGEFARRLRASPLKLTLPVGAYLLAIAPVLLAGRTSFSSYLAVSDGAVHMVGADYLIRHGMDFSHLDLRNSYGQLVNDYYNMNYPSGGDTLFGASAKLLSLSLIWAFQPFNAFMLAISTGPAWLLARRMGLRGLLAGLAALTVTLPALVYGYELFGSVKEITALSMILSLGALCVLHPLWLGGSARAAIPFALLVAGGVSSLGAAFGAWALTAIIVLAFVAAHGLRAGELSPRRLLALIAAGAGLVIIAAWPTWTHISGSVQVAQSIASTANSGNLTSRLKPQLVFGMWLWGDYQTLPAGSDLLLTQLLIVTTLSAALIGALHMLRTRAFALLGWLALMLIVWLAVSEFVTAWANAKTLMLTSPAVVLLAWGGVAGLRASPLRALAPLLAGVLTAGVLVSDAMQYHSTNLAPTGRYQEMAKLDALFAGQGPTIFTGFDEYSLYLLRDLDIAGPDFRFMPVDLPNVTIGHGHSVQLERTAPEDLVAFPLIVTRRNPLAPRPPSAYSLAWQGTYYQVWRRRPDARVPLARLVPTHGQAPACRRIRSLAAGAPAHSLLTASLAPTSVRVQIFRAPKPPHWGYQDSGISMYHEGTLSAPFSLPRRGPWGLWLQGQMMSEVRVAIDGRQIADISGRVGGDAVVPEIIGPFTSVLAAGRHTLSITRVSSPLAPGDGGVAVLSGAFLVPAGPAGLPALLSVPSAAWRSLCGRALQWIELVPA